jgi:hypothetical protein
VAPALSPTPALALSALPGPAEAPDPLTDPDVPDPLLPDPPDDVDPLGGGLLGASVWDTLADDDGLASLVGVGLAEEEPVGFGFALPPRLAQLVDVALGVALPDALAAAERELAGGVTVAVLVCGLLLADVGGLVLVPAPGLLLPVDGLVEELLGGVVTGVADGLVRAELPGLGLPDAFALAEGQDAPGFGVFGAPPAGFGPPPFSLTGPPVRAGVVWVVELWPVTDALSWAIAWRSGGTAIATTRTNKAQAIPKAGRSSPSRQSPVRRARPRRPPPEEPEGATPARIWANERRRARARPAEPDLTRARICSRPSGRGSMWSAAACSSRRRNSAKSCPGAPSGPWPYRVMNPAPGPRGGRPCRGLCGS